MKRKVLLESFRCKECKERYSEYTCDVCHKKPRNLCKECHKEIKHGIITPIPFNVGANPCGHSDPDDDFSFDRAVKEYERG